MQECGILCDRLMVLVRGEMKFIGKPNDWRQKYVRALRLLILLQEVTDGIRLGPTTQVKMAVQQRFKPGSCVVLNETEVGV